MFIVSIDPGATGGIATRDTEKNIISLLNMPDTAEDLYQTLYDIMFDHHEAEEDLLVLVEKQGPRPSYIKSKDKNTGKDELKPMRSAKSNWTFAEHYGEIKGILVAIEIRREFIEPKDWQKEIGIKKQKKESQTDWKNRLKVKAQQLFPKLNITLKTADALLILEAYCRMHHLCEFATTAESDLWDDL